MNSVVPYGPYVAIICMGIVTATLRFSGYWLMGNVQFTPRIQRIMEALPGCVVAALILPILLREGAPAVVAVVAVALLMAWWRKEFAALAVGVAVAMTVRSLAL
jgi:uncharacterized membrane protein